jgi:hypothetical protein
MLDWTQHGAASVPRRGSFMIHARSIPPIALAAALAACLALTLPAYAQRMQYFTTPTPLPAGSTLIVGFTNGIDEGSDEDLQDGPPLQLGASLRALGLAGVYIETADHTLRRAVLKLIESATGRDSKGRCGQVGCRDVRLIFYGQAKGGQAVFKLTRDLNRLAVPVALTVQVENVGPSEDVIPPNVARAASLAGDRMPHRPTRIIAQDPAKTQILANLRYTYEGKWADLAPTTWAEQFSHVPGSVMEAAVPVWNRVEDYILDELRRAGISGVPAPPPH